MKYSPTQMMKKRPKRKTTMEEPHQASLLAVKAKVKMKRVVQV